MTARAISETGYLAARSVKRSYVAARPPVGANAGTVQPIHSQFDWADYFKDMVLFGSYHFLASGRVVTVYMGWSDST